MARKVAKSSLNASTIDIINVIRQHASYEYQQSVPVVETERDIPKIGEIIYGTPALANQFINALVNRIALVVLNSATFNNPYANLKKGFLEFGETVEDIFVNIANIVDYNPHKAKYREYQRTIPDVRSAFHIRNWQVMYPVTIEDNELQTAFLSVDGVQSLIEKIVDQVYTAAEYDEFLLFKYLIIKNVTHGKLAPISIGDGSDLHDAAVEFRAMSSQLTFMSDKYNEAHVKNVCPRDRQIIFMDAHYNAQFDVEVLASAFNMDKADFMGRLYLIDDFTSFDNDRFEVIRDNNDSLELVTDAELEAMKTVKAVIMDENWFQVYDNLAKFTEKYAASGLYWNYFYHVWKTISTSPFADAVVFITDDIEPYSTLTFTVDTVSLGTDSDDDYGVVTLNGDTNSWQNGYQQFEFIQTNEASGKLVAVEPYGCYMFNAGTVDGSDVTVTPYLKCNDVVYKGDKDISMSLNVGDVITFTEDESVSPTSLSTMSTKTKKTSKKKTEKTEE